MKNIGVATFLFLSLFCSAFANEYVAKTEIEAANFLAAEGIIVNHSGNTQEYRLGDTIRRDEVIKIIAKLSGEIIPNSCSGTFRDVDKNGWGCKYIEWALSKNYIAANPDFRPEANITKTEAMKLILKVQDIEKVQVTDNWQEDYMMTAYEYGIIANKYSDYNADATRGWIFQIATVSIEKEEEIKIKVKENLISDEAF